MLKTFRVLGLLEALSFLYLLMIAMPQKYMQGITHATKTPGALHGGLFLAYVALAFVLSDRENWPRKKLLLAFVGSVLPFGTLVFDHKYLKKV